MPKLRTLSGAEVLAILGEFGFRPLSQRGSHMKVRRIWTAAKGNVHTAVTFAHC